ncbi:MAG: hypothetical protein ABJZ55_10510 [Fuerstiella sp.]
MRLTLRTLLAYLDDRLDPSNARELGQKISSSPFARELAQRIKGVVRKRRLASDQADQKTIDGNLIAEYLDDQLTPELVALIEKEILASDHSLAEVAAAHQILGLLADPLDVNENLKQRLYQMDPVAQVEAGEAMTEAEISASEEWKPLAPATVGAKRSPMLVLALMVLGWLVLLFLDSNLYRSQDHQPAVAAIDAQGAGAAGAGNAEVAPEAVAGKGAAKVGAGNGQDAVPGQMPAVGQNASAGQDSAGQPDAQASAQMSESDRAIAQAQALAKPAGSNNVVAPAATDQAPKNSDEIAAVEANNTDAGMNSAGTNNAGMSNSGPGGEVTDLGSADVAMADPEKMDSEMKAAESSGANGAKTNGSMANGAGEVASVQSAMSPHSFFVDDASGALLLSSVQKMDPAGSIDESISWLWSSNLEGTNNWNNLLSMRIACVAAPFSTIVGCQASGWEVQAVGSSVFQGIDEKYAGLRVLSGQLILTKTVAAKPEPFLLEVGGRQFLLNPEDTQQKLAITVRSLPSVDDTSAEVSATENDSALLSSSAPVLVTLAAFDGPATAQSIAAEDLVSISAGEQMMFRSDGNFPGKVVGQPVLQWEWVLAAANRIPAAQEALQKTLIKKLKGHDSVREAVAAVAEDGNPMIARWAVQVPTAERDVEQLVRLLFQSQQQVVRSEAFYALQEISRTVSGGNSAIVALLETRLNLSEMQQAMRMVKDISRISFEDRLASEWLVGMLDSDRLVLREMAISTLEQHLNNRNNYFADETKSRRERAVRRWNSELDRNDGRLIPPQE